MLEHYLGIGRIGCPSVTNQYLTHSQGGSEQSDNPNLPSSWR